MAGIGFELRKIFAANGYFNKMKAVAVSSAVTVGPMLLSVIMVYSLLFIMQAHNVDFSHRERFMGLFYYCMIFSNILSSALCQLLTRHVADRIFEKQTERLLPALYGGILTVMIMLLPFGLLFLFQPSLPWAQRILSVGNFFLLGIIWVEMIFLSAMRDYRRIVTGFAFSAILSVGMGYILIALGMEAVTGALLACQAGYTLMALFFLRAIQNAFPSHKRYHRLNYLLSALKYPQLLFIGFFGTLGIFAHCFILWGSPDVVIVSELVRYVPRYDIAVFNAFITIIPLFVRFTVMVEVNFFKSYNEYFSFLTQQGNYGDIQLAYREIKKILKNELLQLFEIQLIITILSVTLGSALLPASVLPLSSVAVFRILALAYMFYGMFHCIVIFLLYFDDRKGAVVSNSIFFILSVSLSAALLPLGRAYYGVGFLLASLLACIVAAIRLSLYIKQLNYYIFCSQPMFRQPLRGKWAIITDYAMKHLTDEEDLTL